MNKQVRFPREYFAKALLEYSDWRWALFREFIQNAVDAGANNIHFEIGVSNDNSYHISVVDDGCGMSEHVVTNVLLVGGGSLKPEGAVGGFGYAKALLFFAHDSYIIRTSDLLVNGSGGEYNLSNGLPRIVGCHMRIELNAENAMHEAVRMCDILKQYVSYMRLSRRVNLCLNGNLLASTFEDFTYKVDTQLGALLFSDARCDTSRLVVSVNGLPMFVHKVYTSGVDAFVGVLNLKGSTFDLLTTNRDALKGQYSSMLTGLIQRMIEQRFSFKVGQSMAISINWKLPGADIVDRAEFAAVHTEEHADELHQFLENSMFPLNFNMRIQSVVGKKTEEHANNVIDIPTVLKTMRKRSVCRMATSWKLLVHLILSTKFFADQGAVKKEDGYYFKGKRIDTGFIFANDLEGLNMNEPVTRLVLMNPMLFDKKASIPDLCDLAIHECTHLIATGHNDYFIDTEMRVRRSLRLLCDEATVDYEIAEQLKLWKEDKLPQF